MNRGIETFFREAFDGLKSTDDLELCLVKGTGNEAPAEHVAWTLPRTGWLARVLGAMTRRNGYVIEQWTSFPSVARQIRAFHPSVVFYSDANLGFLLFRFRRQMGVPYKLLFSNGGPVHPPFPRTDFVHQVAPCHYQQALCAGVPPSRHFMVPYGINMSAPPNTLSAAERKALRQSLGLPVDRQVVLSVGWIRRFHKRMDYVIEEIAALPRPRPFLQLLGAIDPGSSEISALGKRMLGPDGFAVKSVPYEKVLEYYRAADCFVLASLREGFGRVYLEALMHGLPVICHRNHVTEHILGAQGVLADLRQRGALARLLICELQKPPISSVMRERWQSVRDRFSWQVLAPFYREMFEACAGAAG